MRLFLFSVTLFLMPMVVWAKDTLQMPLQVPIALSASFGELRPNHFHAGIDIKTEQRCGLPVYAVEDGYVSRVKMAQFGYGNCLYLTHPDKGITTVYAHLDAFNDTLTQWIENYQYEVEDFQIDVQFPDTLFPVKKGQLVAISGNTGSSGGPHVHFEVRNQDGEIAYEPQAYFTIEDSIRPKFKKVGLRPALSDGTVNGQCVFQSYRTWQQTAGKYTTVPIEAWGKVGLEFMAFDYMNGQGNFYGLKRLEVYVDSVPTFTYQIDQFSFEHDRAINAFIDYAQWVAERETFMCAYMPMYQPLALFWARNDGYLLVDEERDYQVTAIAYDYAGNSSQVDFVIRGKKEPSPLMCQQHGEYFSCQNINYFQQDSLKLLLPRQALYNDLYFKYTAALDTTLNTTVYSLHYNTTPLHESGVLQVPIQADTLLNKEQYYLAYKNVYNQWNYVPATYNDGNMVGEINRLGDYTVLTDTVPPTITMLSKGRYKLVLRIGDKQTDIRSYKGYIDNQWVLFSIDAKNRITYHYDPKRIARGKHTLRVEVEDRCGNVTVYETPVVLGNK